MDWAYLGKRLGIALAISIPLAWVSTIIIFRVWTLTNFALTLFLFGVILILFGACLRTPFIEAMATRRYAVNPQTTRDTMRHFSDRREEQTESSVVILSIGVILLCISLVCFSIAPFIIL